MEEKHIVGEEKEDNFSSKVFSFMVLTKQKLVSCQPWFIAHLFTLLREEVYGKRIMLFIARF